MKTNQKLNSTRSRWTAMLLVSAAAVALTLNTQAAGKGGGKGDNGAERIPVSIKFFDESTSTIKSDGLNGGTYTDGELKGRVSAFVGGNVAPDVVILDTNTSNKRDSGRKLTFVDLGQPGTVTTEAEFETERDVNLQGMSLGAEMTIGARFVYTTSDDKNRSFLTFGDTAPTNTEPSCEGVANSNVTVRALEDVDGDGTIDSWLIWADETRIACLIKFVNWVPQTPIHVNAPFAILVEKVQ